MSGSSYIYPKFNEVNEAYVCPFGTDPEVPIIVLLFKQVYIVHSILSFSRTARHGMSSWGNPSPAGESLAYDPEDRVEPILRYI